jgi:Fe-S cluster assembly ATP-binding protein
VGSNGFEKVKNCNHVDLTTGQIEEKMLEIKNLHVKLEEEDKIILRGVDLTIKAGEVHAIMGPNGSGKSTLSYVLSGRGGYQVTQGSATLEGTELLEMEPEVRAAAGLFLAFQYPVEIPGVGNMTFLRTAVNAQRKARGQEEMSAGEFLKVVRERAKTLKIDAEMLKRPVNVGFSGGEKKRNEILQMAMLEPKMCVLDETDSGLDVDAMKLVAEGVNALRNEGRSFLVITHYQRLLDHIKPDVVHIMAGGRIIKSGGPELALEVEANGYAEILEEAQ